MKMPTLLVCAGLLLFPNCGGAQEKPSFTVVVYYHSRLPSGMLSKLSVFVNDKRIARVPGGCYFSFSLAPGRYFLRASLHSKPPLDRQPVVLRATANQAAYYSMHVRGNRFSNRVELIEQLPQTALPVIKTLKPLDPKLATIPSAALPNGEPSP